MQESEPDLTQPRYFAVGMEDVRIEDDWLTEPEATRLQGFAYTKRRDEARLGRWTAKQTLARSLGLDPDQPDVLRELVVRNAPDGAPEVFIDGDRAPLSISMTDRADWATCVVLSGHHGIGCDLELIERRSEAFVADYFTSAEQKVVANRRHEHDLVSNLIWSAKESALKVLRTGLRRDTRSVEVRFDCADRQSGWDALSVLTAEGDTFDGWWRTYGEFVLTYVCAQSTGPPTPLVEPSPLDGAVPAHRWLADPRR